MQMVEIPVTRPGRRSAPLTGPRPNGDFAMAGLSYLALSAIVLALGILAARL